MLKNTLSGELEEFKPIKKGEVGMYNCGPTVYNYAHIGNLRAYVFSDILKRTLKYNDYQVTQVINITDVGHLTDEGLDKIEERAKEESKGVQDMANMYIKKFFEDLSELNINVGDTIFPKASEHINEQIEMIEKLESRGFTYKTSDGIYFNTAEYIGYGKLGNINIDELKEGARVEKNNEKKNMADFALWKFSEKGVKRQQEWKSPWGVGFPGWHIECSAMSMKHLGEHFDIHTGGVDHIFPHHNNEIAQSESATGKAFVNYWLHGAFLNLKGEKISKSKGNLVLLDEITEKGLNPLSYRYWLLTATYNSPLSFSWDAIEGTEIALNKLHDRFRELPEGGKIDDNYRALFKGFINNDLNTPKAIALLWNLLKDNDIQPGDKKATLLEFDKVLALGLDNLSEVEIPKEVLGLVKEREKARGEKDWDRSDELRNKIEKLGFGVKDTSEGSKISKI